MFFNVFIKIDEKEQLITDCFYYNAENHYLNYHSPYQDKDSWCSVSNVGCEIKVDKPLIYIYAKTIKELSRWLRENPTREFMDSKDRELIFCHHSYYEDEASKEVPGAFLIREDDGAWREPLVEVEK